MKKVIKLNNKIISIEFKCKDKNEFNNILNKVKTIDGRKWNQIRKIWTAPIAKITIEQLKNLGFEIDNKLNYLLEKNKKNKRNIENILSKINELNIPLFNYQKEGVERIEEFNGIVLLADEMGVGKTIQTIAWTELHKEFKKILVIVPASLKITWKKEFKKWTNQSCYIIDGRNKIEKNIKEKIIIINYDVLEKHYGFLEKIKKDVIIIDECHYIKNSKKNKDKKFKTIRTRLVHDLCKKNVKYILALSGTPILNKPIEIFSVLHLLKKSLFPSRWHFAMKYCSPKHNGFGWDFGGASNTTELNKLLQETVMIRRLKKDVLKDLPGKLPPAIIYLEILNRKEYEYAKEDFKNWYYFKKQNKDEKENIVAEALIKLEKLKQIVVEGKKYLILEWIDNFLESNKKLGIFAEHHNIIDFIYEKYNNITVKLDGRDAYKQRQEAIDLFQTNDNIKIFIGNIKAAGIGITLTAASDVVFIELPWTPGELDQAIDRFDRIGQKNVVTPWFLIAENTIEEQIMETLDKKRKVLNSVLDGKEIIFNNFFTEIIKKL